MRIEWLLNTQTSLYFATTLEDFVERWEIRLFSQAPSDKMSRSHLKLCQGDLGQILEEISSLKGLCSI